GAAALGEVVAARTGEERRPRHVDVGPRSVSGELLEKSRGKNRGGLAQRRGVLQVRERGVDVAAVAPMERPGPRVVAANLARLDDEVAPSVVVPEDARVEVAERECHRTGQGREVDEVRRALLS